MWRLAPAPVHQHSARTRVRRAVPQHPHVRVREGAHTHTHAHSQCPMPCPPLPLQATYDNLDWDLCSSRYGNTKDPPETAATELLDYLTSEYNIAPGVHLLQRVNGTRDK